MTGLGELIKEASQRARSVGLVLGVFLDIKFKWGIFTRSSPTSVRVRYSVTIEEDIQRVLYRDIF
jgi:hypothetical protein